MNQALRVRSLTIGIALAACIGQASAADVPPASNPSSVTGWRLERVRLADGKSYQGLISAESPRTVEFVEVRRPAGKPLFLIVRSLDRKQVASLDRLPDTEHEQLRRRLEAYKQRARIEAQRMEDLALTAQSTAGIGTFEYQGDWFSLSSTANEAMTRRSIVRLEQIFAAYRQVFPTQAKPARPLNIRMFGDGESYSRALAECGLKVVNPAVYLPEQHVILAASEINRFAELLADVKTRHAQQRAQLEKSAAASVAELKQLGEDLKAGNVPTADRLKILAAEKKKLDDDRKAARRQIDAIERQNDARFHEVSGRMFARLAHEAFHAYLDAYVYPRGAYSMPRWLNEGLAQVFEAGLLDGDALRIDAPNATALRELQADLRGARPLRLADVLTADADAFLSAHAGEVDSSAALYRSAWGLAQYLMFESDILGSQRWFDFLEADKAGQPPIKRFEALVGMPLDRFERQWRDSVSRWTAPN